MYRIKALLKRLQNPLWLPGAQTKYVWKEDTLGVFNIFYILSGKPTLDELTPKFFTDNTALWEQALTLANSDVQGLPIERTATILQPKEFITWLEANHVEIPSFNMKKFKETINHA